MRSLTLREVMMKRDTRRYPDPVPWVCIVSHKETVLAITVSRDFTGWMLRQLYPSRPTFFGRAYALHAPSSNDWIVQFESGGYPVAATKIRELNPVFNVVFNVKEMLSTAWLWHGQSPQISRSLHELRAEVTGARAKWIEGAYGRSLLARR